MSIADVEPFHVLLVEDDPGDVLITTEALQAGNVVHHLDVVGDGESALAFLRGEGRFTDRTPPDLVLLDLNLPRLDGWELLAIVKADQQLCRIPVVVLTTSDAEEDVLASYNLHANAYVTKPVDVDAFLRAVREIDEFFLTVVRLPHRPSLGRWADR